MSEERVEIDLKRREAVMLALGRIKGVAWGVERKHADPRKAAELLRADADLIYSALQQHPKP